jgi:hypothetical protein
MEDLRAFSRQLTRAIFIVTFKSKIIDISAIGQDFIVYYKPVTINAWVGHLLGVSAF